MGKFAWSELLSNTEVFPYTVRIVKVEIAYRLEYAQAWTIEVGTVEYVPTAYHQTRAVSEGTIQFPQFELLRTLTLRKSSIKTTTSKPSLSTNPHSSQDGTLQFLHRILHRIHSKILCFAIIFVAAKYGAWLGKSFGG